MAGAVLAGCVWAVTAFAGTTAESASGSADSFTLNGTMTLSDTGISYGGAHEGGYGSTASSRGTCQGSRGYDDIGPGTSVTVYGSSGAVIGSGTLGQGTRMESYGTCVFPIAVTGVPRGEDFYQVEVSHRGKIAFPEAEVEAGRVALNLG